jgi:AAA15 family ATPase/GTPase
MLFNIKPLKGTDEVRSEIRKIISKQKKGSIDDLTAFSDEIEELLVLLEFKNSWKSLPVVARAARVELEGTTMPYSEDIVLPNTKHDLDLVIKMLNYMREQKQLKAIKMPLFVQPDEIALSHKEGRISYSGGKIISQISVVLQKGAIMYVGFVFGRDYVILQG